MATRFRQVNLKAPPLAFWPVVSLKLVENSTQSEIVGNLEPARALSWKSELVHMCSLPLSSDREIWGGFMALKNILALGHYLIEVEDEFKSAVLGLERWLDQFPAITSGVLQPPMTPVLSLYAYPNTCGIHSHRHTHLKKSLKK